MHVSGLSLDLNWFLQFIFTAFVIALGLLHVVKNTASKYFVVDANFEGGDSATLAPDDGRSDRKGMPGVSGAGDACVVCGSLGNKKCSGCKAVRYCSQNCQSAHWKSEHKLKCKDFQLSGKMNSVQSATPQHGRKISGVGVNNCNKVALPGTSKTLLQSDKILFPYDEFVKLFNWDYPGFPPCGLINCGNSCFANVVLQCLSYTRPLFAYLLEKGHQRECRRNDWCFLCEFQTHVERARQQRLHPFSPINILSRLPSIGGNLGYGKQEDAHEFMRFAVDTMQSVCLDEFGGEKALHPSSQETTLIQYIFGGHLQSQVICTKCKKISNQYENMMDLTVEIQGDAASLEECLEQFTVKEWLHGENMYKCDGCNDYVKAWKRLTVRRAPNILTIALKRFQSGRFGKLNKRVTFPETLDLSPYMSEAVDGTDVYKLYAVVVHVDMLNASFFGHYICYIKDFCGNWYRVDDHKVVTVELEEVLSQGAYMLLYSRICARSSCLRTIEPSKTEEQQAVNVALEVEPCPKQPVECITTAELINPISITGPFLSGDGPHSKVSACEEELSFRTNFDALREEPEDVDMADPISTSPVSKEIKVYGNGKSNVKDIASPDEHENRLVSGSVSCSSVTSSTEAHNLKCALPSNSGIEDRNSTDSSCVREVVLNSTESSLPTQNGVCEKDATSYDVSVAALRSVKENPYETNSVTSKCLSISCPEMEKDDKSGKDLPRSSSMDSAAGKLVRGNSSSGATLKPLFPPGFLGKRTRNTSMRRDGNAPGASGESPSACNVDSNCNGFSKPVFFNQNEGETKDQPKAHSGNGSSFATFAQEQPEKRRDGVESVNICNGDANAVLPDGSSGDIIISDAEENNFCPQSNDCIIENGFSHSLDMPSAETSLAIDGEVPELGAAVQSKKIGTNSKGLAEGSEGDPFVYCEKLTNSLHSTGSL